MIKEQESTAVASTGVGQQEPQNAGIMDVLRNQNFVKLWTAQILSQTAQQIVNIALVLQITALTGSSTAVSGIVICFTIPAILFSAIAGVFVERNSKKMMLILTNLLRGLMVVGYIFVDPSWGAGAVLPIFYIITLLFSTVSQFFNPAEASLIPLIVRREQLVAANSLFNLTLPATQLLGFVVLGPLLLSTVFHNNYNGLYVVIVILCLLAAASTYFLPQDKPEDTVAARRQKGEKVGVGGVAGGAAEIAKSGYKEAAEELAEGWQYIRKRPIIMNAIIYWSIAIAVFMMLGTIGPNFLEKAVHIESSKLFYILLPGGIGLVIGVLSIGRFATPQNRESMINISLLGAGAALLVFSLLHPILVWIFQAVSGSAPPEAVVLTFLGVLTFLLGLFNSFISVPAQTALQEQSTEDIRARVFSAFFTISNAILLVPVFLAGALADSIGYAQSIFVIGAIVVLIAGLGLYRNRGAKAYDNAPGASSHGPLKAEEAEAALTAATPAPRPIMAKEHQDREEAERRRKSGT